MSNIEQRPEARSLNEIPCTLTDAEWISLINKDRDGLPECCANISDLRDQIIQIVRDGAMLAPWNGLQFIRAYRCARDGHDFSDETTPVLMKLVREVVRSMGQILDEVHGMPHQGNGE